MILLVMSFGFVPELLVTSNLKPTMVMPGPGAVWPAMVTLLMFLTSRLLTRGIVPPTSNTTVAAVTGFVLLPSSVLICARTAQNEPAAGVALSVRLVT